MKGSLFWQLTLAVVPFWQGERYPPRLSSEVVPNAPSKRVAIVGAGSAGLGTLAALLDLPEEARLGWTIDLFEARDQVGGVWFPDPNPPSPPALPGTPLYDLLRTNTPHPTMTYPGHPFPRLTPLYPTHEHIQLYHENYARQLNLTSYIHLNHSVARASYNKAQAHWDVKVASSEGEVERAYDHLVVASGHNHFPRIPEWEGADEWLSADSGNRKILHSIYYRNPEDYANHTVVVVGFSASGSDMAIQISPIAKKTYLSYSTDSSSPFYRAPPPGVVAKPRISHFTRDSIVFQDKSVLHLSGPTSILLGTGYELVIPFLDNLEVVAEHTPHSTRLSTNRRYIRPLHQGIFAIDSTLPLNSLSFVGLPYWISNCPSDYSQGLYVAHGIASPELLPGRRSAFQELLAQEDEVRANHSDPFVIGHRFSTEGSAEDYQDGLVDLIRGRSSFPPPEYLSDASKPYVEDWRRRGREVLQLMKRGWLRAEEEGIDRDFLGSAETESEWVGVMQRVTAWQKSWEEAHPERVHGSAALPPYVL